MCACTIDRIALARAAAAAAAAPIALHASAHQRLLGEAKARVRAECERDAALADVAMFVNTVATLSHDLTTRTAELQAALAERDAAHVQIAKLRKKLNKLIADHNQCILKEMCARDRSAPLQRT